MNATSAIAFVFASALVFGTAACGAPDTVGSTISSKPSTSGSATSDSANSDGAANLDAIPASAASKAAMGVSTWEAVTANGTSTIRGYDDAHALKATVTYAVAQDSADALNVSATIDTQGKQASFAGHTVSDDQMQVTAHTFDDNADLLSDFKLAIADTQSATGSDDSASLSTQSLHPLDTQLTCKDDIDLLVECGEGVGGLVAGFTAAGACPETIGATCLASLAGFGVGLNLIRHCAADGTQAGCPR